LPEIPSEELGETSLEALRSAYVNVDAGSDRVLRVSALDLRSGVGAARVDVLPSLQTFRTEPAGAWPAAVKRDRWRLDARRLEHTGALFRFRRGEWTRLLPGSGVNDGENLIALADQRSPPPNSAVVAAHAPIRSAGLHWGVWEIRLPREATDDVLAWLRRLGHEVVPRQWSVALATPPRGYGHHGEPIFWIGDLPLLVLEAPSPSAGAMISLQSGTNSYTGDVRAGPGRFVCVSVGAAYPGPTRLLVLTERSASVELTFVPRPPSDTLADLLAQPARIRIQVGLQLFEAWQEHAHKVRMLRRERPAVHVELGDKTARARVSVWERGKLQSKGGLNERGVEREIENALASAGRIDVDAGNLGRLSLVPERAGVDGPHWAKVSSRLAWRDHVLNICSESEAPNLPALVDRSNAPVPPAVIHLDPAILIRSRITLRQRIEAKGNGS